MNDAYNMIQSGLNLIGGPVRQEAQRSEAQVRLANAQVAEAERNLQAEDAVRQIFAGKNGNVTEEDALAIMGYSPELGIRLLESISKNKQREAQAAVMQQFAGGGAQDGSLAGLAAASGDLPTLIGVLSNEREAAARLDKEERDRDFELNSKPLTEADQRAVTLAQEGLASVQSLKAQLFDENGRYRPGARGLIAQITPIPGMGALTVTPEGNKAFSDAENLTRNNLYLKSGAAAPEGEVRGNMGIYAPSLTDDDKSAYDKLKKAEDYFNSRLNVVKGARTLPGETKGGGAGNGGWSIRRLD